jgi:hypothetical protein
MPNFRYNKPQDRLKVNFIRVTLNIEIMHKPGLLPFSNHLADLAWKAA